MSLLIRRTLLLASGLALAPVVALSSQTARDTAACRALLNAPTPDSQIVRFVVRVRPFDTVAVRMSPAYREIIGDGIRSYLEIPRPLPLTTYDIAIDGPDGKTNDKLATLSMQISFGATLHRDGHLTNVRALGGERSGVFDDAMISAIQTASDSGAVTPAVAPDVVFKGDSIALRFIVQPDLTSPASKPATRPPARGDIPLLLVRLPARRATQSPGLDGARIPPKYPDSMRGAKVVGKTVLTVVIDESGKADPSTIDIVQTPAVDFVKEILEVMPGWRFKPLMVEGCPVPVVVSMPFEFHLTP